MARLQAGAESQEATKYPDLGETTLNTPNHALGSRRSLVTHAELPSCSRAPSPLHMWTTAVWGIAGHLRGYDTRQGQQVGMLLDQRTVHIIV